MAVLGAMWHDRTARGPRLVRPFVAAVALAVLFLGLGMTTGVGDDRTSDPIPSKINN